MSLYHVNVTVHLLAALFWLGGMFFLALVGAPALRELDDPRLRARLFGALGRRFRSAGWWAIGILVVTGVANLHFRGVLDGELLSSADFWSAPYGRALAWKLGGVGAMIVVSALHDFVFGPRASGGDRGPREGPAGPRASRAEGAGGGRGEIPEAESGGRGRAAEGGGPGGGGTGRSDARRSRKIASWLARLNALLGILVVAAAVRLARGG